MSYAKTPRRTAHCLHCGDKISYGRTDKKYCCEDCRVSHHNELSKGSRTFRRRLMARLLANYELLERLVMSGIESIPLIELVSMGFNPDLMTSCRKTGCHMQYSCFDIIYIMTQTRVSSISKIQNVSLNLQREKEILKHK